MNKRILRSRNGFTLLETLLAGLLGLVLLGLIVGLLISIRKGRLTYAALLTLDEQASEITQSLQEDLSGAGAGTANGGRARLLVKADGRSVPAAFVSADGRTLTVLKTAPEEIGKVLRVAGADIVISGKTKYWETLKVGQVVLFVNPVGDPAFMRLTAVPRQVAATDLPGGKARPRQTAVLTVEPATTCGGLTPLSTTVGVDAIASPLGSVVRYYPGQEGLVREELAGCVTTATLENATLLAPTMVGGDVRFLNRTRDGGSLTVPADPTTLTGIGVTFSLKDEATRLERKVVLDIAVAEWKEPAL